MSFWGAAADSIKELTSQVMQLHASLAASNANIDNIRTEMSNIRHSYERASDQTKADLQRQLDSERRATTEALLIRDRRETELLARIAETERRLHILEARFQATLDTAMLAAVERHVATPVSPKIKFTGSVQDDGTDRPERIEG